MASSRNHCCRGKKRITYSECVSVALVIWLAMRMRRIILSSVECLVLLLTMRRLRVTIAAVEKKRITYSECVSVALVIWLAIRMRRIILSSVECLVLLLKMRRLRVTISAVEKKNYIF